MNIAPVLPWEMSQNHVVKVPVLIQDLKPMIRKIRSWLKDHGIKEWDCVINIDEPENHTIDVIFSMDQRTTAILFKLSLQGIRPNIDSEN
jgi:hypothetical protein